MSNSKTAKTAPVDPEYELQRQIRLQVVSNGVRWVNNIIVELLNNHARFLNEEERKCLKEACTALSRYDIAARHREKDDESNRS